MGADFHWSEGQERGWRIITLENEQLSVDVLPARGATILSIRERAGGTDLMWRPRWGLRPKDTPDLPGSSEAVSMGHYSGGWSTLFPNAGGPSMEHGVEWPMHGEVWLAPFDGGLDDAGYVGETMLVRSPFQFRKRIRLDADRVTVVETAVNQGVADIEVVWNQHPAFGAPLLGQDCVIASSGRTVMADIGDPLVDPARVRTSWPEHVPPAAESVDLSRVPAARSGQSRRAFLTDFGTGASVSITNQVSGLRAEVQWEAADFPYAWYWLEAGGREGFPWFGDAYVLGIEPCTSFPTGGIGAIRDLSGTQVTIPAGAEVTRSVSVSFGRIA